MINNKRKPGLPSKFHHKILLSFAEHRRIGWSGGFWDGLSDIIEYFYPNSKSIVFKQMYSVPPKQHPIKSSLLHLRKYSNHIILHLRLSNCAKPHSVYILL